MLGKQPSTIDGYRSPIVDKLGNSPFNISKDENLARLLDSFLGDRPKGRSGIPSWNFSLAVHQLRLLLIQSGGLLEAFDLQDGIPLGPWVGQVQK